MISTSSMKCLRHLRAQDCIRKTSNILLLDRNRHSWPEATDVRGYSSHGNHKPCACLTSSAKSSSHLGIHPRTVISGGFAVRAGGYTLVMQLASVLPHLHLHGPATAVLPLQCYHHAVQLSGRAHPTEMWEYFCLFAFHMAAMTFTCWLPQRLAVGHGNFCWLCR